MSLGGNSLTSSTCSMDATNSIGCVNINGPVVGPSIASVVEKHVGATRKNSVQFIRKASRSNSIATEMSPDQIRAEARELVEVVREMTGDFAINILTFCFFSHNSPIYYEGKIQSVKVLV